MHLISPLLLVSLCKVINHFILILNERHDFEMLAFCAIINLKFLIFVQIKRKLPKVNRAFASQLLENEEAENEKDADGADDKKTAKKKKKGPTSSEIFEDERFRAMFENKVFQIPFMHFSQNSMSWKADGMKRGFFLSVFSRAIPVKKS